MKYNIILFAFSISILFSASGVYAVNFVDHTGYIPDWAKPIGQNQALGVCNTGVDFNSQDFDWCLEYAGFVMDELSNSGEVNFKDHKGYAPGWVKGMGQNQALGVCNTSIDYNSRDFDWCMEFAGRTIDELTGDYQPEPVTETQIDSPSLEPEINPSDTSSTKIPDWVKNIALWYGQGQISEDEFVSALQYLVKEGILIIPSDNTTENNQPPNLQSPFELEVVSCTPQRYTNSIEVQFSVTSHLEYVVSVELAVKGLDVNGKVLSVSTPILWDLVPGHTTYDNTYIDGFPNLESCEIGINEIID